MTDLSRHKDRLLTADLSTIAHDRSRIATVTAPCWTANLARHRVDADAQSALLRYAHEVGLDGSIKALFGGAHVNPSEDRPALHWSLRGDESLTGEPAAVRDSLKAGDKFADAIYGETGEVLASTGQPFRNVVHIGIGGSDFGPRLLADAFEMERNRKITLRFCANVDPLDLDLALDGLDPRETLVIGVSKSFGTEETLYNLTRAKAWLETTLGTDGTAAQHLALVTSRGDRARAWLNGAEPYLFDMPASVGGRFSIWSNGSLACRILLGPDIIDRVRKGARDMDVHTQNAPLAENLPARLALLDYWNRTVLGYPMRVQLAYARRLRMLPTYLQQLEMESNGKSVRPDGSAVSGATAPALWGGEGSIGQHSYHQWLHQGTDAVPAEFILATEPRGDAAGRTALTAHALAQAEVLANGRHLETIGDEEPDLSDAVAAQKVHAGGRPSTFLSCDDFGPEAFGSLIALFEHRTYLAGVLWGVNSFDQWGVEAGKTMAGRLKSVITGDGQAADPVTAMLISKSSAN